jgi:hypothetical protein
MMSDHTPGAVPNEVTKWLLAVVLMIVYGTSVTAYFILIDRVGGFSLSFWSSLLAATAGCMLATSFAASSVSHFTGWPNLKLGYQKQIGVTAFWLCFAYCITLLWLEPAVYWYGFWDNLGTPNFILGLSAMVIFGLMVAINSKPVARYLSWPTISFFLNVGFVGYAFLVMRAILLEWPLWSEWLVTFSGPPTNRFLLSLLAIVVLLLRLAVIIDRRFVRPR